MAGIKSSSIDWRKYGLLLALVIMGIALTAMTEGMFFTPRNLLNLTRQVAVNGVLAVGMTFVILIAGIDLSIGSVVAFAGITVAYFHVMQGCGAAVSIIAALVAGALAGMFNGFFVTRFSIHPFIITLGMMTIARGLALIISKGASIAPMSDRFAAIGNNSIPAPASIALVSIMGVLWLWGSVSLFIKKKIDIGIVSGAVLKTVVVAFFLWLCSYEGIPIIVAVFAAIALCGVFILHRTAFGRYMYAIGGNATASHLSGINVKGVKFLVFTIMGLLAGVAGILLTARLNAATPTMGNMFELDAIASVVIGGTSLMGGFGSVEGTIIGAFIIGILNNGLQLLNVDPFLQYVVKGLIIIGAVMLDVRKK
ncbi:MAG: inner-membrane translocator [Elusimicrobiota bacterium]